MIRKPQGCTQPLDLKKDETVNHDLNETLFLSEISILLYFVSLLISLTGGCFKSKTDQMIKNKDRTTMCTDCTSFDKSH